MRFESMTPAERSPAFHIRLRDHYRRTRARVTALVEEALGPDAAAKGADARIVALFLIAVFDGWWSSHVWRRRTRRPARS